MPEQTAVKNETEEIIGHSSDDPATRVSVKLDWRDEEGLWYQAFRFAGDGDKWQSLAAISTDLAYNTLLKHFGLYPHKNKLNFGEIAHSSHEKLKQLQIAKYPRLGQIEIFPLVGDHYYQYYKDTVKCEFTRCEKTHCIQCQKDFETCWIGYASSLDFTGRDRSHIFKICPDCGLRHENVI